MKTLVTQQWMEGNSPQCTRGRMRGGAGKPLDPPRIHRLSRQREFRSRVLPPPRPKPSPHRPLQLALLPLLTTRSRLSRPSLFCATMKSNLRRLPFPSTFFLENVPRCDCPTSTNTVENKSLPTALQKNKIVFPANENEQKRLNARKGEFLSYKDSLYAHDPVERQPSLPGLILAGREEGSASRPRSTFVKFWASG